MHVQRVSSDSIGDMIHNQVTSLWDFREAFGSLGLFHIHFCCDSRSTAAGGGLKPSHPLRMLLQAPKAMLHKQRKSLRLRLESAGWLAIQLIPTLILKVADDLRITDVCNQLFTRCYKVDQNLELQLRWISRYATKSFATLQLIPWELTSCRSLRMTSHPSQRRQLHTSHRRQRMGWSIKATNSDPWSASVLWWFCVLIPKPSKPVPSRYFYIFLWMVDARLFPQNMAIIGIDPNEIGTYPEIEGFRVLRCSGPPKVEAWIWNSCRWLNATWVYWVCFEYRPNVT